MTFRYFNAKTGENVWKSKNVDSFQTLSDDKRKCKSSAFTVMFKEKDGAEQYDITAKLDDDVQLMYTLTRPSSARGWKFGSGDKGGFSYFGDSVQTPHGYVVHRFWPYAQTSGMVVLKGRAIDAKGQGMFVQAIQGMRPNLVASRWNFANFQSPELDGTSVVMMEFTTTHDYGPVDAASSRRVPQTVTIASVVSKGQLLSVTGATRSANGPRPATYIEHEQLESDADTGYEVPQSISYAVDGVALVGGATDGRVKASLHVELGKPSMTKGLIEKVDVLAEIPYMVRKLLNYVAGTKPYIYQTLNPAELTLELPASVAEAIHAESPQVKVKGTLFEEHTFISL